MSNAEFDEEMLRRLYHQVTAVNAESFAHEIGEIIPTFFPKETHQNITIYGTRIHDEDLYPNDYSTMLLGALESLGYKTASYPLNVNGLGSSIRSIPVDLISRGLNLVVDFHMSRVFGIYLAQFKQIDETRPALYACPTPPPGSLWDYQGGNKLLQIRRPSV